MPVAYRRSTTARTWRCVTGVLIGCGRTCTRPESHSAEPGLKWGDSRGADGYGTTPDYREAGYQRNHAPNSDGMPAVCQVACKMCSQVNPVPFSNSEVQFRCDTCGFLNTFHPPIYRAGYGYGRSHLLPVPIFCSIQ